MKYFIHTHIDIFNYELAREIVILVHFHLMGS